MEHRKLGRTGLAVSRLGLGCGNFGGIGSDSRLFGMGESEETARALMDHAFEIGINFFDTADSYGGGRSQQIIGRWLTTKPSSIRQQILISSKSFNPVGDGPNDRGLSRRHLKRQIEASLKVLGVERLDTFLIHEPDPQTPIEETLSALDDLIHDGKIHYIGASNVEAWRLMKALGVSDKLGLERFQWVQNSFSLLECNQEEMLALCAEEGLGFTPFSPLAGGWLTGKYAEPGDFPEGSRMTLRPEPYRHLLDRRVFEGLGRFRDEAQRRGLTMAALAHAWLLNHPRVTAVITGPRTVEHLDDAKRGLEVVLSAGERSELESLFA
ncbi:MAG TPA: aldo/keto reductase [Vicinamibacteria bacterium]|nr:aldo/keto reductase [Vicinamibacteria bacterium]